MAFGSEKSSKPDMFEPQNEEQMMAIFNKING